MLVSRGFARSWLTACWPDQLQISNTGGICSTEEKGSSGKQSGMDILCRAGASRSHSPSWPALWVDCGFGTHAGSSLNGDMGNEKSYERRSHLQAPDSARQL